MSQPNLKSLQSMLSVMRRKVRETEAKLAKEKDADMIAEYTARLNQYNEKVVDLAQRVEDARPKPQEYSITVSFKTSARGDLKKRVHRFLESLRASDVSLELVLIDNSGESTSGSSKAKQEVAASKEDVISEEPVTAKEMPKAEAKPSEEAKAKAPAKEEPKAAPKTKAAVSVKKAEPLQPMLPKGSKKPF